jgi:polyisoprenoid-binding protein YceI
MAIPDRMRKIFLLTAVACAVQAQAVFSVEPAQSSASFTLPDVLHTVHGSFKVKRGSIQFDPSTGAASGEIVVDALSGNSGSEARDKRMHRNILESQKYPEIAFVPSRLHGTVNPRGESKVEIEGTFTIHGASHPLTAPAAVTVSGDRLQVKAHFAVPYVAWGMKNPSTLFLRVAESVDIDVDASGRIAWSR